MNKILNKFIKYAIVLLMIYCSSLLQVCYCYWNQQLRNPSAAWRR